MPGGDLFWFWAPYENYINLDKSYGDVNNHFIKAQTWGNIIEISFGMYALVLSLTASPTSRVQSAFLVTIASVMTLWKTFVYWFVEAASGWENTNLTNPGAYFGFVVVPTAFWFILPALTIQWGVKNLSALALRDIQKKHY